MEQSGGASPLEDDASVVGAPQERVFESRTATLRTCLDGIVRITVRPGAEIVLADLQQHFATAARFVSSGKAPVLVDTTRVKSVTREAREFVSGPEAAKYITAQAVVVGSPVSRLIGNFFLGLNKPSFPTRLFSSEDDALAWLKGFVR